MSARIPPNPHGALISVDKGFRASFQASTILQKKAFIFAVGWWLRAKHGFKKYPAAYKAAKDNIGCRSLVFGVPRWPKKMERGPLQQQASLFYKLMESSLDNNEWHVNQIARSLIFTHNYWYHTHVELDVCLTLWTDTMTDVSEMEKVPYNSDQQAIARRIYDTEDFNAGLAILCDALMDTGYHDVEVDHLRTGRHTPACPVIRKIGGIK